MNKKTPSALALLLLVFIVSTVPNAVSAEDDGYFQDVVTSDGPIIYGTGLSDEDRKKAWKQFFFLMVETCGRQQGTDALQVKLAQRCMPGDDFCSIGIDAMLTGIGGIQEPRKVLVMVFTDGRDVSKQRFRMVCTWPAADIRVCRDWTTGKLLPDPDVDKGPPR